jgi:hypothetical protein
VMIANYKGTISNANLSTNAITSTTSSATSKDDGISLFMNGADDGSTATATLTKATLNNNSIIGFPNGHGIEAVGAFVASPTLGTYGSFDGTPGTGGNVVDITNNLIRGHTAANPLNGAAIVAEVDGRGQGNFNIQNNGTVANPITNTAALPLATGAAGDVDVDINMEGNHVASTAGSGTPATGVAVSDRTVTGVGTADGFNVNARVVGNTVTQSSGAGFSGAWVNSNGSVDMKVANNTYASPSTTQVSGININQGSSGGSGKAMNMCLDITGNTAGAGPVTSFQVPGISVREFQDSPGQFQLVGLTPSSGATNTQAEAFMSTNNPGSMQSDASFNNTRAAIRLGTISSSCPALGF